MEIYIQTPVQKIRKKTAYGEAIHAFDYDDKTVVFRRFSDDKQISEFDKNTNCYRFIRRWSYIPDSMREIFSQRKVYLNNRNIPRFKKFKSDYEGKALSSIYPEEFSTRKEVKT